jgi:hypothetical protein
MKDTRFNSMMAKAGAKDKAFDLMMEALEPFDVTDEAWGNDSSLQIELRGVDDQPQPCVMLGDILRVHEALTAAKAAKG